MATQPHAAPVLGERLAADDGRAGAHDRLFWLTIRRALLMMVKAIELRHTAGETQESAQRSS